MKNDRPIANISASNVDLYPHLKITNETFPRVLATRRIGPDDAEYFGAFLPKTALRILMDLISRVFRLRSCDIPVDGSFPVPCTQYYRKRCLAPCVAEICSPEEYLSMLGLVRLFLSNDQGALKKALRQRISASSEELAFEEAAEWRDILQEVENFWANPRWNVWLDDAVDTYEFEDTDAGSTIFLATQRNRHVVGRKVFTFGGGEPLSPDEAIGRIIAGFYVCHVPREIQVPVDLEDRKRLQADLSARSGRDVKIVVRKGQRRIGSRRALIQARDESELDKVKPVLLTGELGRIIRDQFALHKAPSRIEAFDVAHISGKRFVTASSVWSFDRFATSDYHFEASDRSSETKALAKGVLDRLRRSESGQPDLIVLDGGKPQLNAVTEAMLAANFDKPVVAAVKPAGRHSAISRFLLQNGDEVPFNAGDPSHAMLQILRDDAHDLANRVHRDLRDMGHHYELAAVLPGISERERRRLIAHFGSLKKLIAADDTALTQLAGEQAAKDIRRYQERSDEPVLPFVVPIRYDAEGGSAEDLRPIATR